MKKCIALLLALVLTLGLFAGCADNGTANPTEAPASVADAKAYLYAMYKDSAATVMRGFDRVAVVAIDGVSYSVKWTVDNELVTITSTDTMATIAITEKPAEAYTFTLTATITDAEGKTETVTFTHNVEAVASTGVVFVEQPEYGVPYKFALNQNALDTPTTLYLTGEMDGNYLATSANVLDAVDVVLEETTGGFYITFMEGETKKYVNITTYTKDDGSLKNTQKIEDAPSVPYTWDAERGAVVADLGDLGKYYIGTYSSYKTMSTSATSYIEDVTKVGVSQFPAGFCTVTGELAKAPVAGQAYVFALQQNALEVPAMLYLTGEMSGNYLATSPSLSDAVRVYLEETEGGYYLVFLKDGAKKYVNVTTYTKDDGSLKNTQKIEDAPSVPYTWDAERGTLVADLGDLGKYYIGTYNTYNTMSTSNVTYIEDVTKIGVSQFPAGLYDFKLPSEDLNAAEKPPVDLSTPAGIVAAAFGLAEGEALEGELTLTGKIVEIPTAYSEQYGNVTVVIEVEGKNIECFRLTGEGADKLVVGDVITVTGIIKNYNGKVEFDAKCTFTKPAAMTPAEIVAAAFALGEGEALVGDQTLTGKIVEIPTAYSEQYGNVTVVIEVEGKNIECFRLKGEGADKLAVGDTITVTGTIKNYKGKIEFDAGCTFTK